MNIVRHLGIFWRQARKRVGRRILAHRVQYHNPTLLSDPTAIWDYGYGDLDAIQLGEHVLVGPFAEIIVYKRTRYTTQEGRLIVGDRSAILAGANIRAAGGVIRIGNNTAVSQHCVLVAVNHRVASGMQYLHSPWDESKTGIEIGNNVWIAAGCILLPGSRVGDNAVIGAGSVVTGEIPANEIWAGVPARKIRDVPAAEPAAARNRPE